MAATGMGAEAQPRGRTSPAISPAVVATSPAAGLTRAVAAAAAGEAAADTRSILVLLPDGSLRMYDEQDLTVADVLADFPHHDLAACASQPSRARLHSSRRLKPGATYYLTERVFHSATFTRAASAGCLLTLPQPSDGQSMRRYLEAHGRHGSFHEIPDRSRHHSVITEIDSHHNGRGYRPQHQHHHKHQNEQHQQDNHDRVCQHIQRTRRLSYSSCASVQSTFPFSSTLLSPSPHRSDTTFSHPPVSPHGAHHLPCHHALSTASTPPPFPYPSSSASSSASSAFSRSSSIRCILNPIVAELDLLEAEEDQREELRLEQTSAPQCDYPCTSSSSSNSNTYATHSLATPRGRLGAKPQSVLSRNHSPSPSPTSRAQAGPPLSPGGQEHGGVAALTPAATTNTTPKGGSSNGGGGKRLAAKIKASISKLDPRGFRQMSGKYQKQRFSGAPQSAQEVPAAPGDAESVAATGSEDTQTELHHLKASMASKGSEFHSIDVASSRLEEACLALPGHTELPTMCAAPRFNRALDDYICSDVVFLSGPVRSHVWY